MEHVLFLIAVTTLISTTASPAFAPSAAAFSLPGSTVAELRYQITTPRGGADAANPLKFVYNPSNHVLVTMRGARRISSKVVVPAESAGVTADAQPVAISWHIAKAIVRGIDERTRAILPSLLKRERDGHFTIVGFDHGTSVFFAEEFVSPSYVAQSATPLSLDICTPRIAYSIAIPSYAIEKLDVNFCGLRD